MQFRAVVGQRAIRRLLEGLGCLCSGGRRVEGGEDLGLARFQQFDQRLDAWAKALDLRRIDAHGVRELLVGEATHGTGGEHVLEGAARRAAGVGGHGRAEADRVETEVRVKRPAKRLPRGIAGRVGHGHLTS